MAHLSAGNPAPGFEQYGGYRLAITPSRSLHQLIFNEAIIAASTKAFIIREQGLHDVLYIPRDDILVPLTRMKGHSSYCPFKGTATYWSLEANGHTCEKAAWSYDFPHDELLPIRGHLAFYMDRIDCYWVDGVEQSLSGPGPVSEDERLAPLAA